MQTLEHLVLFPTRTFQQFIIAHEPTAAIDQMQFVTNISLLHVSAPECHPQGVFQIKGVPEMTNTQF
jgi:hypothetical protein